MIEMMLICLSLGLCGWIAWLEKRNEKLEGAIRALLEDCARIGVLPLLIDTKED